MACQPIDPLGFFDCVVRRNRAMALEHFGDFKQVGRSCRELTCQGIKKWPESMEVVSGFW